MENFVTFELAVKLKEKGFICKYPFAMYDENGDFYPLFTSCDEDEDSKCIFGNRMYYDYDDFIGDKDAVIAPTISQALKWFREEKKIHIAIGYSGETKWCYVVIYLDDAYFYNPNITKKRFDKWGQAAINGIEYVLNNILK